MSNNKKKKFHENYFKKIIKLSEEYRLQEAIVEFQKYINNYPNDLDAYVFYADTLIKANRLEEAEIILKEASKLPGTDLSKEDFILIKIKLLSVQNKYKECYELFKNNMAIFYKRNWSIDSVLIFLKKKLGLPNDYKGEKLDHYIFSQIVSYDKERSLEHIKKYHTHLNENIVWFNPEFPLSDMFSKVQERLSSDNKMIKDIISDIYLFKYSGNGHIKTKLVDYFAVITLRDSNEIITMYPCENKGQNPFIDLTPIMEDSPKLKRVSQIDKFNLRYNKK